MSSARRRSAASTATRPTAPSSARRASARAASTTPTTRPAPFMARWSSAPPRRSSIADRTKFEQRALTRLRAMGRHRPSRHRQRAGWPAGRSPSRRRDRSHRCRAARNVHRNFVEEMTPMPNPEPQARLAVLRKSDIGRSRSMSFPALSRMAFRLRRRRPRPASAGPSLSARCADALRACATASRARRAGFRRRLRAAQPEARASSSRSSAAAKR